MSNFSMTAAHATEKGEPDTVFAILKKANEAIDRLGKSHVINASIGSILDDEGNLAVLPSVIEHYRQLPSVEIMNYAPIEGLPDFLESVIDFTFQDFKPQNTYIKAVATPGGTGAIRHVFYNYLEPGEKVLVSDWFWSPYRTIAVEAQRQIETYSMFDGDLNFTLNSLKKKVRELLQSQNNLVVLFNTPAHNPTGYAMSIQDWRECLDFFKDCSEQKNKKIIILVDLAYIDFAGPRKETREFMKLFGGLPENILVTMAFSMSKSFLSYGLRSGALIGISPSESVVSEFSRVNSYSSRGIWSNASRGAQKLMANIVKCPALTARVDMERNKYIELIKNRSGLFMQELREADIKYLPYCAGFFITIPTGNSKVVAERLSSSYVFAIPLKKGIRFALCSLPTFQIHGLAQKIKEVFL